MGHEHEKRGFLERGGSFRGNEPGAMFLFIVVHSGYNNTRCCGTINEHLDITIRWIWKIWKGHEDGGEIYTFIHCIIIWNLIEF